MLDEIRLLEVLPIEIFEVGIDALDPVRRGLHPLVVAIVVEIKLFGAEQLFDDVLVLFEDVLDNAVGFTEQTRLGVFQPIAPEPFFVLKMAIAAG